MKTIAKQEKQVISLKRITDYGEVYTAKREINAMLDLVKQETERIESRFLEPACGTGNFLAEVLKRKSNIVKSRYSRSQLEYERYSVVAVSSIYGIDILEDNVIECRNRLFNIFNDKYENLYKKTVKEECKKAIRYILEKNIVWGDTLSLKTIEDNPKPLTFSEWASVNGSMIKRRDFAFNELSSHTAIKGNLLFSDLGKVVFIPTPIKEFPLTHYLKVAYVK